MKQSKQAANKAAEKVGEEVKHSKGEEYLDLANKALKGNLSIKGLAGVSDEKEEAIYGQAYLLYNTGRYKEAAEIFRVLITVNSTEPKYMMGLAACFHMMKEYEAAMSSYTMCTFIDPESPVPHFHLSDCYLQLGDDISAVNSLKSAIKRCENKPEFKTLREKSEITLRGLEKEGMQEKK
ncbi:MAG: SycD/LcrH family type III secretion system chaperone [Chlamydiia bacterium]|nr:SycD/LcrH family type III secretion system chaperone [Chlamydiia bacterium]